MIAAFARPTTSRPLRLILFFEITGFSLIGPTRLISITINVAFFQFTAYSIVAPLSHEGPACIGASGSNPIART